ncbi:uncharacterized protein TM35_000101730 [Trypanosoma theileri]|uniref:Uncharacterized protein n=1 Tax=Trypanosoma theileri TaxID=67003 RepID=A0A1X0NZ00_9TRYP|nr:uncharacterized protein TM35_000101730 [Trypanosoma theileri]ORC89905.1 hypothetical protein TM35_000101730 [Trypanosoma theileri]
MSATAAVERPAPSVLPPAYQYVPAHVIRRQPRVDVVELDIPSVYQSEATELSTAVSTPRSLAKMRESPTKGSTHKSKKRSSFESRKMASWVTTTTNTTVFLPTARIQVRSVPEILPPSPSPQPQPQQEYLYGGMSSDSRTDSIPLITSGSVGGTQTHRAEGKKARASSFTHF